MRYLSLILFLIACEPQTEYVEITTTDTVYVDCDLEVSTLAWINYPYVNFAYTIRPVDSVNVVNITAYLYEWIDEQEYLRDTTHRVEKYLVPNEKRAGWFWSDYEIGENLRLTYGLRFECE